MNEDYHGSRKEQALRRRVQIITVAVIALLGARGTRAAEDWLKRIESQVARVEAEIVSVRHQIHQHPELSNREEKTARLVADYLKKLGLETKTGVARQTPSGLGKGADRARHRSVGKGARLHLDHAAQFGI